MNTVRPEVVVAGHICVDIIPTLSERHAEPGALLSPGKLTIIGPALTATGGAVSNTGQALWRLGLRTSLMGKVGDDTFGHAVLDIIGRRDPELAKGMVVSKGENTSYTLVFNMPGIDRSFLHCPGANDTFGADDVRYDELEGVRLFHFGYPPLMQNMFERNGVELETMFHKVKACGLTTSLDMAYPDPNSDVGHVNWQGILTKVLPYVDVFLPSLDEALFMVDRDRFFRLEREAGDAGLISKTDSALLRDISGWLLDRGAAIVALKLGDQGIYLRTTSDLERLNKMGPCAPNDVSSWANRELLAPCFKVNLVGATGSGDCTIAGFLAGLIRGFSPENTLTCAVAVGACSVEQADATSGVPTWDAVQARIQAGWDRRPIRISLDGWRHDTASGLWKGVGEKG